MNEPEETGTRPQAEAGVAPRGTRELFAFAAGGRLFAVAAEETDGVAENLSPAPLPHAPPAVLGVVGVRGRMRTLLDTSALLTDPALSTDEAQARASASSTDSLATNSSSSSSADLSSADSSPAGFAPRVVVALRGDEQLALAADSLEGSFAVDAELLANSQPTQPPLLAALEHEGRRLHVLDPARLFDAAMRGTERRRSRA
jgi:hypothetical protein